MNKKRKLALMLALEMFLSSCALERDIKQSEDTDVNADKEIVLASEIEDTTTLVEEVVEIQKTNEDLIREKEEEEKLNDFKVQFGYAKEDATLVHHDGSEVTLEKYQRVLVLEDLYGIYYVETYDNDEGIILKSDIEIIPDTFIEVDISSQTINFFVDGEILLTSDVVTGLNNKTPLGSYKINSKARNITLRGRGYASFVYYWLDFLDNKFGFHDATWRDKFGGDIYKTNGSHGCVNLPKDFAKKLYENVPVGTKVLIHK